MDETWTTRELPLLQALTHYFDDPDSPSITWKQAASMAGMDNDTCKRALAKLVAAKPAFVEGVAVDEESVPARLTGVTERALVAAGQWPTPESLVADLVEILNRAADAEREPERKTKLRLVAETAGGMAQALMVAWAAGALPHP